MMMSFRSFLVLLLAVATAVSQTSQSPVKLAPGRKYTSVERMGLDRLRRVREDCRRHQESRKPVQLKTGYQDYRAILHAHAEDSPHTGGNRPEMLKAAQAAGVRVIMLTDHRRPERDFINDSWRGSREGVLFIPGAESEGFLLYPVSSIRDKNTSSRDELIAAVKEGGGNIFLSHAEERLDWSTEKLDGLEIYNHHTDVKDETEFYRWLQGALSDPERLKQIEEALRLFPQEVFAAQHDYLAPIIQKWDRDAQSKRLTGVAANDCHHNQVFTVTAIDDKTIEVGLITSRPVTTRITTDQNPKIAALVKGRRPGELISKLDFDPYARSFIYVATHILAKNLTEQEIRDALKKGHAYVAHDYLCHSTGFAFVAQSPEMKSVAIMGDEVKLGSGLKIKAEAPAVCILKLFHNGSKVKEVKGRTIEHEATSRGVYRLEAWLEVDGELRPWIYSNHIYVR